VDGPETEWLIPKDRRSEGLWNELRDKIKQEILAHPNHEVLFLGDSIMQGWRRHQDLLERCTALKGVINGGIWSDGLQHMLWRLSQEDFAGIKPKLVVFLGGTNNGGQSATQIAAGINLMVGRLLVQFPKARVLLLGIFPMDRDADTSRRIKRRNVNQMLAQYDWPRGRVVFLDLSPLFLGGTSVLQPEVSPDFLHLSRWGYELWMAALCPAVTHILNTSS
jgi:lysophospholipase L1-like esterase